MMCAQGCARYKEGRDQRRKWFDATARSTRGRASLGPAMPAGRNVGLAREELESRPGTFVGITTSVIDGALIECTSESTTRVIIAALEPTAPCIRAALTTVPHRQAR